MRYVIKRGSKTVFQNHEGYSKEELKPIRNRMTTDGVYDRLAEADPYTKPDIQREINAGILAGSLPYISRSL